MPFDFTPALVTPGRLVPMLLNMLPGSPTVHLEYLGEENASFLTYQLEQANAVVKGRKLAIGRGEVPKVTAADLTDVTKMRAELRHAIRKLEAKHTDGTEATAADIPDFIAALPPDTVRRIHAVAENIENFRNSAFAEPKALAEK